MPDALEFPGMRRAVVPLVRAGLAVVDELVADGLPGLAAVVGALDHLAEPAAGLRGVDPIRVGGRALEVVHLPAGEMRAGDVPLLRLPSDVRTNAPFRVPTRTRTLLILHTPFAVDHPRNTVLIGQHAPAFGPERLLDGHADGSVLRQARERCVPPPLHR